MAAMDAAALAAQDYDPATVRRALHAQEDRTWHNAPVLAALQEMRQMMAEEFENLHAAVASLGGEGGEISTSADRVITAFTAAINNLNGIVTGLQADLAAAQGALADANAKLTAGEQVAAESTDTITSTIASFDAAEAKLDAAAAALEPAPAPNE